MANKNRGEVQVEIGGETRLLRLDFNAIAELESMHRTPITKLFEEERFGHGVIRDAIFVGLRHANRRLTPEQVGRWMDEAPERLVDWVKALSVAFSSAMGVAPDPQVPSAAPTVKVTPAPVATKDEVEGSTTTSS